MRTPSPRETYIKNVQDILGLGDNKCKPMPTPIVQTRQKSDEDEPRLGEGDRRVYHGCVGIFRHLLKYRPDIAFAVHEVSKTPASLGRCRSLKIATTWQVSLRDTEARNHDTNMQRSRTSRCLHRCRLEWIFNQQQEHHRWNTQDRISEIERVHERSELSNVVERKRVPRCGDDDGRGTTLPTTSGILGNAVLDPIENRFDSTSRYHPATGVRTSQAH